MGFKRTDSPNRINSYDCEAKLAPAVGFEPTTNRLTADRSTTELRWIKSFGRTAGIQFAQRMASGKFVSKSSTLIWLRGRDLNPRPSGYEPDELPGCSTPHFENNSILIRCKSKTHFAWWKPRVNGNPICFRRRVRLRS